MAQNPTESLFLAGGGRTEKKVVPTEVAEGLKGVCLSLFGLNVAVYVFLFSVPNFFKCQGLS